MGEGSRGRVGCWNMRVFGLLLGRGRGRCFELWAESESSGRFAPRTDVVLSELRCPKENPGNHLRPQVETQDPQRRRMGHPEEVSHLRRSFRGRVMRPALTGWARL